MTESNYKRFCRLIRETPKETLLKVADICDGHSIFKPETFLEAGLHPDIVDEFADCHLSNPGNHKEVIFSSRTGKPVEKMLGIYGLEVIEFIARVFKVSSNKNGRGFRANDLKQQLHELWK